MVNEGATLMVGGGSTCALFSQELAMRMVNVRIIITNSVFVANGVRPAHNVEVTLPGGSYRTLSQYGVGSLVHLCVSNLETETLCAMARHARKCVLIELDQAPPQRCRSPGCQSRRMCDRDGRESLER